MDYEALSRQLVRALRAKRSQQALNRRLGLLSNCVHAWESGTRFPSAADFLRLLELSGHDPVHVLTAFGVTVSRKRGAAWSSLVAPWLDQMRRDRSHAELARAIGCNRNTVRRWLEASTQPRLPQLLGFIEATTHRVVDFLATFLDPKQLPSICASFVDLQEQRRLAYDEPWTHAVLRAMELDDYRKLDRHQHGFIARKIGITTADEQSYIRALARSKQIQRSHGRWRVTRVLSIDTRQDAIRNAHLKRHWTQVALERLGADAVPANSLYSYNLFAISREGLERIRALHLDYYARMQAIVAACEDPTCVVLANIQLVPLAE